MRKALQRPENATEPTGECDQHFPESPNFGDVVTEIVEDLIALLNRHGIKPRSAVSYCCGRSIRENGKSFARLSAINQRRHSPAR